MKNVLKLKLPLAAALLMLAMFSLPALAQQKFDKAGFYKVMDTGDVKAIDAEIAIVQESGLDTKDGYEGALLMRKAGKVALPKNKLKYFKQGRIKLETAIAADNENTEFRFLRLAIEENAPGIVKYKADIEKDKAFVIKNYKNQSQAVKDAIMDYTKKSKVLHANEL